MKLNEKEKPTVKKASDSDENDDFAQADDEPWVKKKKRFTIILIILFDLT